ncbi:thioesterase family protein [uncultured Roseibium sp.]|uniref:thioesterase family protein n=1 Tax=uncultured Roseibium sp. TaxID=1936171 RepID=UPI00263473AF|nr:thioesterase family protein [uncultured Roseibium sp.]
MTVEWEHEPIKSKVMIVQEDWIDYNGHLNMAYYNVLFDKAVDEIFLGLGLGADYVKTRNASFFTAETHVCYLRELSAGMPVRATLQLIDFDHKRAHFYQELWHAEENWLSATMEQLSLHVDMSARKVADWPQDVFQNLSALAKAHESLLRPARSGRRIEIRK